jgi:plastocyanin
MRRLPALILPIIATAALAACSSGGAPGWTYAPAASASASASASADASGSASGSPAVSEAPSAAPSVAPSEAPSAEVSTPATGGTTLTVTAPVGAATAGYDPTTLETAAGQPFTIHFDDQDPTAPHNVELKAADGSAIQLGGDTNFFTGPGTRDYAVPALQPGTYTYFCVVHPTTMNGTLTIK